jgi:hypothetical protein
VPAVFHGAHPVRCRFGEIGGGVRARSLDIPQDVL